jgi:hypothetical protein
MHKHVKDMSFEDFLHEANKKENLEGYCINNALQKIQLIDEEVNDGYISLEEARCGILKSAYEFYHKIDYVQ